MENTGRKGLGERWHISTESVLETKNVG